MMRQLKEWQNNRNVAHVAPLMWFLLSVTLLGLIAGLFEWKHPDAAWWRRWPDTWIMTLQTASSAAVLIFFWKHYELKWSTKGLIIGVIMGAVGIGFWLLPTLTHGWLGLESNPEEGWMSWLGIHDRADGFDPKELGNPVAEWSWIIMRFTRAVVIVALVEEILWRSFLMRFLLNPDGDFWSEPFGKPSWLSYGLVTLAFMLAHGSVDYAGAVVYGSVTYLVAIWTKSLFACVIMHGTANFIMCVFALQFGKFGLL